MDMLKKEDGSISILKLIGLAVVVSVIVSILGSLIGSFFEDKNGWDEQREEE